MVKRGAIVNKQPFMFITLICAMLFISAWSPSSSAAESRVFNLKAKKYTFTAEMIEVNQGDSVTFEILAVDTSHGIGIKEYNLDEFLPEGQKKTVQFVADKKGIFMIACTQICGWGHPWMVATLVVR